MKKLMFILSILLLVLLTCCSRHKQCEYGENGYWLYLEEPRGKVAGFFIPEKPNLDIDSACYVLLHSQFIEATFAFYPVKGYIPKEFTLTPNNPVRVHCTLERFVNFHVEIYLEPSKILCIEKI
ncbi:MAG: hypothetical protein IKU03_03505 [Bacteroidales bacterium]|nr:hypothetical protein [Bacteroidales bacterium]